jgi:hypothetical protein
MKTGQGREEIVDSRSILKKLVIPLAGSHESAGRERGVGSTAVDLGSSPRSAGRGFSSVLTLSMALMIFLMQRSQGV